VYEPFLLQLGFISRTARGRIVMPLAYEHFGLSTQQQIRFDDIIAEE